MTAPDLPKRVWDYAREKALLCPGDRVIVALSGGADSVTLLSVLCELRTAADLTVSAVHVHHGLRGAEADADETLCRKLCEQWNVPLNVFHVDVAAEAAQAHETVEQAGRRLRYAFLEGEAEKRDAKIATAHTASDQAETVILHLTRGCGLHGLCGIPPRRGRIIRPLLTCSREQVEAYCAAHALPFATDRTNADVTYARNRVRHRVLPELKAINPLVKEALCRLTEQLSEDDAYLTGQASALLASARVGDADRWDCELLLKAPAALRTRALRLAAPSVTDLEQKHVDALQSLLLSDGAVTLPDGAVARSQRGQLWFESADRAALPEPFCFRLVPDIPVAACGRVYLAKTYDRATFDRVTKVHNLLFYFCLDRDIIKGDVWVRSRRAGDAYRPVGRGTKSLKKLCNESHLPLAARAALPILTDDDGILMAVGFGCDERVRVTEGTKRVLVFAEQSIFDEIVE